MASFAALGVQRAPRVVVVIEHPPEVLQLQVIEVPDRVDDRQRRALEQAQVVPELIVGGRRGRAATESG